MTSAKVDILILLQLVLYHVLWGVLAYGVPRAKTRLMYYSAGLILVAQLILAALYMPELLQFTVKILCLSAAGMAVDAMFARYQWWQFSGKFKFIPLWLCLLWLSFAISLQYFAVFIHLQAYTWALLGALGFPLAYHVAERFGVLQVPRPWLAYSCQGLIWLFLLPALQFV